MRAFFLSHRHCMTSPLAADIRPHPAADLGMFGMFGRTGAPQKGGPTKAATNFFACRKYRNNGQPPSEQRE